MKYLTILALLILTGCKSDSDNEKLYEIIVINCSKKCVNNDYWSGMIKVHPTIIECVCEYKK